MRTSERIYRGLAVAVVGGMVAATASLIAALALVSRKPSDVPPPRASEETGGRQGQAER